MHSAKPKNPNGKGIVLIHEFWGLNSQVKKTADRLAEGGFAVVAVDLYKGKVAQSPEEARQMKENLKDEEVLSVLKEAVDYLTANFQLQSSSIAIWGFCMGGGFSFKAVLAGIEAGAFVIYYGQIKDDATLLKKINKPVLGIFGGLDKSIPRELVENFHRTLHDLNKVHEVYIYHEAGHAFANEEKERYHEESARDAREKTIAFLNKYL